MILLSHTHNNSIWEITIDLQTGIKIIGFITKIKEVVAIIACKKLIHLNL